MRSTVFDRNEWLYTDSAIETVCSTVTMRTARGASAGFQILCRDIDAKTLTAAVVWNGCAPILAECYREIPVRVTENTGLHCFTTNDWNVAKGYATRPAPFFVYDALEPIGCEGVAVRDSVEAVYVSLRADRSCLPGNYTGTVTITAGEESFAVSFTLTVADVVLPAESLKITNWFSLTNMAAAHGVEKWSDAHWKMIEKYGLLMRRMHQNVFWITWDTVDASVDEKGTFHFDFTNCEKLIRLYLSLGFTTIEGSPLFGRDTWDAAEFHIGTPLGWLTAMSEDAYRYTAAFLTAWRDFLTKNGWYAITIQHVGDEPTPKAADEYRILCGIVRKFLPGIPLLDAIETHTLRGSVDIWVPKNDYYTRNRDAFEALRQSGDTIWFYTCCVPGGHYANRLLDMPLLRHRMLFWGNYRYDLPGFLHWGLNHWQEGQDPFMDTSVAQTPTNHLPAGDTHIVYPLGDRILGSMRAEMITAGAEDYELLKLLAARDKRMADTLCATGLRSFRDCDNTPDYFTALHDRLLEMLVNRA